MSPQRLTRSAALGLTLAAFAAPSTAGAQDLRSPDARATGPATPAGHDLRAPDARVSDAPRVNYVGTDLRAPDARVSEAPRVNYIGTDLRAPDARIPDAPRPAFIGSDLRAPDTRDAADGRGTFNAPEVMVVKLREQAPAPVQATDGLDWGDAGIGAAGLLGLAALALGGAFAVVHRRSTATTA
ncbi:MAG TPA: hypothetical protein VKA57_00615 [Solirubrobacteraceae bacterium]|nr:hypothetical protein [Solirubrobacteraceae bacterium]